MKSPHIILGVSLALLAALFYSFLTIIMKRVYANFFAIIFIQLMIGVLILFPFVQFRALSVTALGYLMVIGLIHTLLAYFLYYSAIKKTNFTQIAVLSYLDPIIAIASDIIFFNRQLNLLQILGVVLTFFALYLLVILRPTTQIEQLV